MTNYNREVAHRIFSDELKATEVVEKADEQYAAQYVRTESGQLINRVFVVGTLTECEDVGTETPFWRLKISDPKGHFTANVGMYSAVQVQNAIQDIDSKMSDPDADPYYFVAAIGKIKSSEYNNVMQHSIAIESITESDSATYDRWVAETEVLTAERCGNV